MKNSCSTIVTYRRERWFGMVQQDWAEDFARMDPLAWMDSLPHERVSDYLSRKIYRINSANGRVYLKIMFGLNEGYMQPNRSQIDRLKWSFRPSRALQTLRVSKAMLANDIWCPVPVLAARDNQGEKSRDVFIAEAVELPGLGMRLQKAPNDKARIEILNLIAPQIFRLHDKRFIHGDLLPNNLHVTEDLQRVYFMDNDRTRQWPCPLPWWVLRRNLAQLTFRILLKHNHDVVRAFLKSYANAARWSLPLQHRRIDWVMAKIQRRFDRRVVMKPQASLP